MKLYRHRIIQVYILFILVVLPVIYHNSYIDIRDIKVTFFWKAFTIASILIVLSGLYDLIGEMKQEGLSVLKKIFSFDHSDLFLLGFGIVTLLSCLTSRYGILAFTGALTFKVGGYLLLALIFMYFVIAHSHEDYPHIAYIWALPVLFLELTAILNSLDIDPLHMTLPTMTLSDKMYFVSTIGHIDYLSEYFCLFIPFYIVHLIKADKRIEKIVYSIIVFLGYMAALVIRANGLMLGCLFGLFVILIYSLNHREVIKHYLYQLYLLVIASLFMDLINHLFIIPYKQMPLDTLPALFVNKGYIVLAVVTTLCLFIMHKLDEEQISKVCEILKKILITLFIIGMITWFGFAIYCTLNSVQLAIFNNRINIWRGCIESFKHMSIREKLIGVGPNCVSDMLNKYAVYQGVSRTTAHNEILEYFLSTGLLGGFCYLAFWILIIKGIIHKASNKNVMAYLAGFSAYIGISLVVGPSFLNTVTLFTFLAIAKASLNEV